MAIVLHDIVRGRLSQGYRFAFLHPLTPNFHHACRAMEIRGLLRFGPNPIGLPGLNYNAWYADIPVLDALTYSKYAMLVRDFFKLESQQKFNEVYQGFDPRTVTATVNNPAKYLKGQQPVIDMLVDKYAKSDTPLTFYGTKFSAEGVALFLDSLKNKDGRCGAVNNYEQGLGKTRIGAISTIEAGRERVLVVAPKTARSTAWPNELRRLGHPDDFSMLNDQNWADSTKRWDLLQWDMLRQMPDRFFAGCQYDMIITDELHYASNFESQRSQALERLVERVGWIWGMTGTSIRKRPSDLVNLLVLIRHPLVTTNGARDDDKVTWFFARYCGDWNVKTQEWDLKKPKNLSELHALLKDSMIRHEKAETDLPPIVYIPVVVTFTAAEIQTMEQAWTDYCQDPVNKAKMGRPGYPYADVRQGVLQRKAAELMVPYTIEWAEDLMRQGHKVIMFTGLTKVFDMLKKHFGARAVGVDGRTTDKRRQDAEHRFQTDPNVTGFVGNIEAAGVSLTLTKAWNTLFNDGSWTTSSVEQAGARGNRGGSTHEGHNHFFYAPGTPLETMFKDFYKSLQVIDQISRLRDSSGTLIKKSTWREPMYVNGAPQ